MILKTRSSHFSTEGVGVEVGLGLQSIHASGWDSGAVGVACWRS